MAISGKRHRIWTIGRSIAEIAAISLSLQGQRGSLVLPGVEAETRERRQGWTHDFMVELVERGRPAYQTPVRNDWSFEFRNVPTGFYEIRIVNLYGSVLRQDQVHVREHGGPLTLRLPEVEVSRPVSGTVSIQGLAPEKSRKEPLRAEQAFHHGEMDKSIQHLEAYIRIHPGYVEAHDKRGVRYMRQGEFGRAAQQFRLTAAHILECRGGDPARQPRNCWPTPGRQMWKRRST